MFKISKAFLVAGALIGSCVTPAAAAEKVLFVLSAHHRGYSLPESMDVYEVLSANGIEVEFASPQGVAGLPWGADRLSGKHGAQYSKLLDEGGINNPRPLSEVSVADYDALYVPGGRGPVYDLHGHPEIQRLLAGMYEAGKIVAAVCHGPAALAGVKLSSGEMLVKGRAVTGKPLRGEGRWATENLPILLEKRLRGEGALFSSAEVGQPHIVHDGLLLTGQNDKSARQLGNKLAELLSNKSSGR